MLLSLSYSSSHKDSYPPQHRVSVRDGSISMNFGGAVGGSRISCSENFSTYSWTLLFIFEQKMSNTDISSAGSMFFRMDLPVPWSSFRVLNKQGTRGTPHLYILRSVCFLSADTKSFWMRAVSSVHRLCWFPLTHAIQYLMVSILVCMCTSYACLLKWCLMAAGFVHTVILRLFKLTLHITHFRCL